MLSTPFSVAAVELLSKLCVPAWKVGSGELSSDQLMSAMLLHNVPFLCSTGMATWEEVDAVVGKLLRLKRPVGVFQSTIKYPTTLQEVGINVLQQMASRYSIPVGLSDHSDGLWLGLLAISQGASMLEAHVTVDRQLFGPDSEASLEPKEL